MPCGSFSVSRIGWVVDPVVSNLGDDSAEPSFRALRLLVHRHVLDRQGAGDRHCPGQGGHAGEACSAEGERKGQEGIQAQGGASSRVGLGSHPAGGRAGREAEGAAVLCRSRRGFSGQSTCGLDLLSEMRRHNELCSSPRKVRFASQRGASDPGCQASCGGDGEDRGLGLQSTTKTRRSVFKLRRRANEAARAHSTTKAKVLPGPKKEVSEKETPVTPTAKSAGPMLSNNPSPSTDGSVIVIEGPESASDTMSATRGNKRLQTIPAEQQEYENRHQSSP